MSEASEREQVNQAAERAERDRHATICAIFETVRRQMAQETKVNDAFIVLAEKAFDLAQNAAKTWLSSNWAFRRSLNRELDETILYVTWSKPFDSLVKQPVLKKIGATGHRLNFFSRLPPRSRT